jgi:hypothetical protein
MSHLDKARWLQRLLKPAVQADLAATARGREQARAWAPVRAWVVGSAFPNLERSTLNVQCPTNNLYDHITATAYRKRDKRGYNRRRILRPFDN